MILPVASSCSITFCRIQGQKGNKQNCWTTKRGTFLWHRRRGRGLPYSNDVFRGSRGPMIRKHERSFVPCSDCLFSKRGGSRHPFGDGHLGRSGLARRETRSWFYHNSNTGRRVLVWKEGRRVFRRRNCTRIVGPIQKRGTWRGFTTGGQSKEGPCWC